MELNEINKKDVVGFSFSSASTDNKMCLVRIRKLGKPFFDCCITQKGVVL